MSLEIEKKFLIKKPAVSTLLKIPGCVKKLIRQTYLKSEDETEKRVRCIIIDDTLLYKYTEKTKVTSMTRKEYEKDITAEEYNKLLNDADSLYCPIEKTRISFPHKGKTIEIDIYNGFEEFTCKFFNKAIMEIELNSEQDEINIPSFIEILDDVTNKKEYSNKSISKYLSSIKKSPYLEAYFNYTIGPVGLSYPLHKNFVHIHDKTSLTMANAGFSEIYRAYGLKAYNHYKNNISDHDKETIAKEFFDDKRTLFQREEERIISTESFRRLQYKTQVMVNSVSDDQRTRLLHSLEVEKISRKIAMALGANIQLAETIAIGHDIGHTPFGHAGEYAIRDYLEKNLAGSFSHAIQSVKVLDFLCSHRTLKPLGIRGLGVSKHVLEGVLKHDTDSFSEDISNVAYKLQYDCSDLFIPVGYDNQKNFTGVLLGGIETQIVCWADKIAYMSHDWEEFVSIGYLEKMLNRVNMIVIQMCEIDKYNRYCELFPDICDTNSEKESINSIVKYVSEINKLFNGKKDFSNMDLIKIIDKIILETKKRLKESEDTPNISSNNFYLNNNLYFSSEQYKILNSFFKIAKAWIIITNEKPKQIDPKMDAIFIIYNYLCKLLPHTTTPALINKLIDRSTKNINGFTREEFITKSNQNLIVELTESIKNNTSKKDCIKKAFLVNFDEVSFEAVKDITAFIKDEYNKSTRIENMNYTAKQILDVLYEFYSNHPYMLPLKQRNRIEQEFTIACSNSKESDLQNALLEYYYTKLKDVKDKKTRKEILNILCDGLSKRTIDNDTEMRKAIINVMSNRSLNKFKRTFSVKPKEIRRVITLRIITDYIAGMTDRMAEMKYNEIITSSAQWSQEYTEKATFSVY